jgi:hypothetical protein
MFPFPLPAGSSEPIHVGDGLMIVGFERPTAQLVGDVEATLKLAGWATRSTGGDHFGGMWIVEASKDNERWTLTAQGVDGTSQLGIARTEE